LLATAIHVADKHAKHAQREFTRLVLDKNTTALAEVAYACNVAIEAQFAQRDGFHCTRKRFHFERSKTIFKG